MTLTHRAVMAGTGAGHDGLGRVIPKDGWYKIDPRGLIAAECAVLATSLPEAEFPAPDILAVYRLVTAHPLPGESPLDTVTTGSIHDNG
jgi:hypothetical protein